MAKYDCVTAGETMAAFLPQKTGSLRYVGSFAKAVAGAESNVAVGIAKLGHKSAWISRVGDDEFGEYIMRELRGEGVDVSHVKRDAKHPTGVMFKQSAAAGGSSVFYYRKDSAACGMTFEDIPEGIFNGTKVLHVSGITPVLSQSCNGMTVKAFGAARKAGALVSFDPNIRLKLCTAEKAREVMLPLLCMCDIVLLGTDEAEILFGIKEPDGIIDKLLSLGVKKIAVKLGKDGSYAADSTGRYRIEPIDIPVVDTVGAGDAYAAGFLTGIIEGRDVKACGDMGCLMGTFAVSSYGDTESLPDRRRFDMAMGNIAEVQR